jgi:hypothetical protein
VFIVEIDFANIENDPAVKMLLSLKRKQQQDVEKLALDQASKLEAYRQENLKALEEQLSAIPEENRGYPAVMHDADVFRKRIERDTELLSIDPAAKGADVMRSIINDRYGPLKDFIDTDQYKQAEEYAKSMKKTYDSTFRLGKSVEEMQRIFDTEGPEKAAAYGRTSVMKELNSLWGSDAVGLSEAVLRYNQLIPVQLQSQISGRPMLEARQIIAKYLTDPRNREETAASLIDGLSNVFSSDPKGMMDVARSMQDVSAQGHNQDIKLLTDRTSPYHLKRLGVERIQSLAESDRIRVKQAEEEQARRNAAGFPSQIVHPPKIQEILNRSRRK